MRGGANDFNPLQGAARRSLGLPPYWVVPDEHLNYFNPRTLKDLFLKSGLEPTELEGTFPMELFLLMGDAYVGNDPVGRTVHGKRKTLELNLEKQGPAGLRRDLYRFFLERGMGREVVLYGRAPLRPA